MSTELRGVLNVDISSVMAIQVDFLLSSGIWVAESCAFLMTQALLIVIDKIQLSHETCYSVSPWLVIRSETIITVGTASLQSCYGSLSGN